jgi:hypothetical protein
MKYLFLFVAAAAISCSTVQHSQTIKTSITRVWPDGNRFEVRLGRNMVSFNKLPGDSIWAGKMIYVSIGNK